VISSSKGLIQIKGVGEKDSEVNIETRGKMGALGSIRSTKLYNTISPQKYNLQVKKVKKSHYRLGQALRVQGVLGSKILRQSTHEGGKVVSPTHRLHLHHHEIFLSSFCSFFWTILIAINEINY
jgi:hypothetical protein